MSVMVHNATGTTGAIASTLALSPTRKFQLLEVRLHLDAAGGATGVVTFSATVDAIEGATYDVVLLAQDMTLLSDYVYQPTYPQIFEKGDKIEFAYANGSNATYGLTVIYNTL